MLSTGFDTAARTHWQGEDVLSVQNELERGAPFCANAACDLHVRLVDLQVEGGGNWVTLPDGRTFGRGRYGTRMLCDACGTRRGPVRLEPSRLPRVAPAGASRDFLRCAPVTAEGISSR